MYKTTCLSAALFCITGAFAQQDVPPNPGLTIRSSTQEVVVDMVIHDRHGKLLKKLQPGDLTLFEDGVPQKILSFRLVNGNELRRQDSAAASKSKKQESAAPQPAGVYPLRTMNLVCMVFHDLNPEVRPWALQGALEFLKNELRPNTYIGIFALDDRGLHPMAPFTNNRAMLVRGIQAAAAGKSPAMNNASDLFATMSLAQSLAVQPPSSPGAPAPANPAGSVPNPNSIALTNAAGSQLDASFTMNDYYNNPLGRQSTHYDRVVAIRELRSFGWLISQLAPMPFRKTVFLISPGISRPDSELDYWKKMVDAANAASISFYALEAPSDGPQRSPMTASTVALNQAAQSSHDVVERAPEANLGEAMDRAQSPDMARYAVTTANVHAMLVDLAESTGGFLITNTSQKNLERIMDDVETHYELTFRPANETFDGRFHKIEVKPVSDKLRVEARNGFFAIPAKDSAPIPASELAGLRALNTTPLPHAFDYHADPLRFRGKDGSVEIVVAFDIPVKNLKLTAQPGAQQHRMHASLLALVKDSKGQVVDEFTSDTPREVKDADLASVLAARMTAEHHVTLAPGQYKIETAVIDWESGNASTRVSSIDCPAAAGPDLSTVALVERVDDLKGNSDPDDPLEYLGKRIAPALYDELSADAKPSVFLRVYPDPANPEKPRLRAQFLLNGRLLADRTSDLPAPDASGSIPVLVQPAARVGTNELRVVVLQGAAMSGVQGLRYIVAATK